MASRTLPEKSAAEAEEKAMELLKTVGLASKAHALSRELARMILKKRLKSSEFTQTAAGKNQLLFCV